jgi:hypothetical protein
MHGTADDVVRRIDLVEPAVEARHESHAKAVAPGRQTSKFSECPSGLAQELFAVGEP